jgi:hypothetical protein
MVEHVDVYEDVVSPCTRQNEGRVVAPDAAQRAADDDLAMLLRNTELDRSRVKTANHYLLRKLVRKEVWNRRLLVILTFENIVVFAMIIFWVAK